MIDALPTKDRDPVVVVGPKQPVCPCLAAELAWNSTHCVHGGIHMNHMELYGVCVCACTLSECERTADTYSKGLYIIWNHFKGGVMQVQPFTIKEPDSNNS